MKKTLLTIAIVISLNFTVFAQYEGGGLFKYGEVKEEPIYELNLDYLDFTLKLDPTLPNLPLQHGSTDSQSAPLGNGVLLFIGLGAAYAIRRAEKRQV